MSIGLIANKCEHIKLKKIIIKVKSLTIDTLVKLWVTFTRSFEASSYPESWSFVDVNKCYLLR